MAISRSHDKKSPSQNPSEFFKGVQQGGCYGVPTSVPQTLTSGPQREKVMGIPALSGPHTTK